MASRMAAATRMPFDDLFLVAAQGLLKGCRRYDPERRNPKSGEPYALSTCVVPFIRGAMAQWLRDRGHSSGVRFPDRWRDKAPTVRRLAGEGGTLNGIAEAVGLPAEEVSAILEAQGATRVLDPEAGFASRDPDPWDEAEAYDELAEALAIADQAHAALRWSDRVMLEQAWDAPRRRQLARMPHGQFLAHARGVIRGQKLRPAPEQQGLAIEVPEALGATPGVARRRISGAVEILQAAEQLALFDACHDGHEGGKTAAAEVAGSSAAVDLAPDRSGEPAELPPSAARRGGRRSGAGR